MRIEKFENIITDKTSLYNKVPKESYLGQGDFIIIDQGKEFIGGYTNDKSLITDIAEPVIIFGDHTRILKFIDFPIAIGADGVKVLHINSSKAYPKYIYYYLRSIKILNAGYSRHYKFLKEVNFPIPEKIEDQIRIAKILTKVEALIKQRNESFDLLDEFLKSTFLKMFGDPFKNPMKWEIKKFGKIIDDIIYGTSTPPEYEKEGIPFIRATNIKNGRISEKSMFFISEFEASKIEKCKLEVGDMIIVRSGVNTGDAASIPKKYQGAYGAFDLIVKLNPISSLFYSELINSEYGKALIKPLTQRAAQPHVNSEQVKNLNFYYPPLELQTKFAQIIEKTEILKAKFQNSLLELENLFASLSQKAFRGELDLSKMEVFYEEQYSSTDNDRTEPKPIDFDKITVEQKKDEAKEDKRYGDPFEVDEKIAKKQGGWFYKEWQRLNAQGSTIPNINQESESKVAGEKLANQIKERYNDKHFSFEMLVNFIMKEKAYDLDKYFSSEEIKANPKYDETEDLKVFMESAIVNIQMDEKQKENINPWLHLNQHFHNAKKENMSLLLTKEDFKLIKNRTAEESSGIYFNIVA
jgi:type I restriction enzyme S subunit